MKTEITQAEYLQIVGLYTLARLHERKVQEAVDGIRETLGREIDHVEDAVWGRDEDTVDPALRRMGITVATPPDSENDR